MDRSIIHLDVADFAAAVEQNLDPGLRGRPLIVAPAGAARAVVHDMSEEAFQEGVRKGMPLSRALRLSRKARVLAPRFDRYGQAMREMIRRTLTYSPLVESGEADGHLYMDVTGTSRLFGPPVDVAWRLNREMKAGLGLDPVWSVAPSRLVAKVATRLVKPTGEYIVGPGEEEAFLAPLSLDLIPGLESGERARLREFNVVRVSEAQALDLAQLEVVFDQRAAAIHRTVRGIDPVAVRRAASLDRDLQAEHLFADDTNCTGDLRQGLFLLVERISRVLRGRRRHGAVLELALSHSDGLRRRASGTLDPATAETGDMFRQGCLLLDRAWTRRTRVRHLSLACTRTTAAQVQLDLFADTPDPAHGGGIGAGRARRDRLAASLDAIRERFGDRAVVQGLVLAP
jgi:DNA polymerase-4